MRPLRGGAGDGARGCAVPKPLPHSVMCVTPNVMIYTEQFLVFKTPKTNHFYNSTDHHISIYYAV